MSLSRINFNSTFNKYSIIIAIVFLFTVGLFLVKKYFGYPDKVNYFGSYCQPQDDLIEKSKNPRIYSNSPVLLEHISRLLNENTSFYSFEFFDPVTGIELSYNPEVYYHAASTYKALILVAIMKLAQDHLTNLDSEIRIYNKFQSKYDQSNFEIGKKMNDSLFSKLGKNLTISDILAEMIIKSSNIASNILIAYFGENQLNDTLKKIGSNAKITRGTLDLKAYKRCINNTINSKNLANIYKITMDKKIFNEYYRNKILDYLNNSKFEDGFNYNLPEGVKIAHKYGQTSTVFHDSGIVFPGDKRIYYYTILTSNYADIQRIKQTILKINKLVYTKFMNMRTLI